MRSSRILVLVLTGALAVVGVAADAEEEHVFVQAEGFDEFGGWVLDQQFMDQMGSPFLLAHGLGVPVEDATKVVDVPEAGSYRVWVRTRDWVAPWKAPGAPGRFQVLVDGKPLEVTFGTGGAEWHWQDGGTVELSAGKATLALHDLTGFEGRCDAVLLTTDTTFKPPNDLETMLPWRRKLLGTPDAPADGGSYDLVVVGGGIAGTCAAVAAARLGLAVCLVQDRPVLGGNNSSEVRVWLAGATNGSLYPRVGDLVNEFRQKRKAHYGPGNKAELYEDDMKLGVVRAEKTLTLLLEHRVNAAETSKERIQAVVAQHTHSGRRLRIEGRWFVDGTGDGCVGYLAGADYEMTKQGHMGRCNLWNVIDTGRPQTFPRCPWALDLSDRPFPGRGGRGGITKLGGWYWESGFDHDPFEKGEYIRDWNFRAMYGAWDCLKNVDKVYPDHKLNWAAYVSGKRESRRLMGEVILNRKHLFDRVEFPDRCVVTGWKIDLHLPDKRYEKGFEGDGFISKAHFKSYPMPFYVPYRCFYSRNVGNLFMVGRCVSVTHGALGTTRVMKTGGLMGEVVGMAASVCVKHDCDPRDVYREHLAELKELLTRGVGNSRKAAASGPAPGARSAPAWLAAAGENLARSARLVVSGTHASGRYPASRLNDGRSDTTDNAGRWVSNEAESHWVELVWPAARRISGARIVSGYRQGGQIVGAIEDFVLQYDDGGTWKDIPGAKTAGNSACDRSLRFKPVSAPRVRLLITATHGNVARIWELALYDPPAPGKTKPPTR
ncbi:MAG: FAD-dependent oxidoreductase [Planctomycetota bacterium]